MTEIAILGYGVVGSGVAEVIRMNSEMIRKRSGKRINIKKIFDSRDFPGDPLADRLTKNADEIMDDPSITVVVETLGGIDTAYGLSIRALSRHKHVVTSNKELVAVYGPELMSMAQSNGVSFMFEASVGGGIPIVRPLHKCLSANEIEMIAGILNGTTNYILFRMDASGISFEDALAEAKKLGYAENNPAADIEGMDSCRKIAILASIVFSEYVDFRQIYTEGISQITTGDMEAARRLNCKIKLIGRFRRSPDYTADMIVSPMLISKNHPIAVADDVNNAIMVKGNALGEAMFFGRGAGRLPTASAVVADVIECVMHLDRTPHMVPWHKNGRSIVRPHADCRVKAFLRLDPGIKRSEVEHIFNFCSTEWIESSGCHEINLIVGHDNNLTEARLDACLSILGTYKISRVRVF